MGDEQRVAAAAKAVTDKIMSVGVHGAGRWKGAAQVADEHLDRHGDVDKAVDRLIATHVRMAAASGFLTGLGGIAVMPVAVPADMGALWVLQGRLAGGVAHLRGYDLSTEETQSIILMSLLGSSAAETFAKAGVKIGTNSTKALIGKIPGQVFREINRKVGYRLVTRAGTTGVVNLIKLVPVAGGVVGGSVNGASTHAVGTWAKKNFPA
ncbi:EcsC family protein [Arsenicicoccus dermatophilus]|uniref:EcsC family protein n=1 Tax=Arsenicicoccus dermatophilus TaxID=1076331 RepID=UPI0039175E8C